MKKLLALFLVLVLVFPILGCQSGTGSAETTEVEPEQTEATGERRTLTVANWQGYGSDAEYAVKPFEEKYNCKVVHQYFDSEEALLNMLRTGGLGEIDVVLPNMAYVATGKRENLFSPLDKTKLENFGDLKENIRELPTSLMKMAPCWEAHGTRLQSGCCIRADFLGQLSGIRPIKAKLPISMTISRLS